MFEDSSVKISILNTLIFLTGSLIGQQILGFTLASYMKNCNKIFRSFIGPCILARMGNAGDCCRIMLQYFFGDSEL